MLSTLKDLLSFGEMFHARRERKRSKAVSELANRIDDLAVNAKGKHVNTFTERALCQALGSDPTLTLEALRILRDKGRAEQIHPDTWLLGTRNQNAPW